MPFITKRTPLPFPRKVFIELMKITTRSIEFSFNDVIYQQTDGIAMGSPFGPALSNIFVGNYESKLFDSFPEPLTYYRYMDDTFVVVDNGQECDLFLEQLNLLYPSLQFSFEKECNQSLPFLDVMIEKAPPKLVTSVYRKPTFTGQYIC